MNRENIKWGCVQPLTGGMYLGTEKAIGHAASWIISYPGLTDVVRDKEGNVVDAANERNLVEYLTKHNRMPEYYTMNRTMMQNDEDLNPILECTTGPRPEDYRGEDLYNGVNLVIGVPVCAGLSMASTASAARKDECNCQMIWMEKYVLKTIRPEVYVFENAPTLMSDRGDSVRDQLETIAHEAGYSTVYYKTDTKYHHNCQKRPRTFILFFKNRNGESFIPELGWEHDNMTVEDFFNEMVPLLENDPMNVEYPAKAHDVEIPLKYAVYRFGENWRESMENSDIFDFVINHTEEREPFYTWLREHYDEKTVAWYDRYISHIDEKHAIGKGFWAVTAKAFTNNSLPACMYKNVPVTVHHKENRLYTMREWMYSMGHPTDFVMIGEPHNYFRKMGQNVPANTAKWIMSEATRIVENWDSLENVANGKTVAYFDNTKKKRVW